MPLSTIFQLLWFHFLLLLSIFMNWQQLRGLLTFTHLGFWYFSCYLCLSLCTTFCSLIESTKPQKICIQLIIQTLPFSLPYISMFMSIAQYYLTKTSLFFLPSLHLNVPSIPTLLFSVVPSLHIHVHWHVTYPSLLFLFPLPCISICGSWLLACHTTGTW